MGRDDRQHHRGRDRLMLGQLDQLALATGLQKQAHSPLLGARAMGGARPSPAEYELAASPLK